MDFDPRKLLFVVNVTVFILVVLSSSLLETVTGVTNQNDFKILNNFRNGLKNPELLRWPAGGNDPCGPPAWPHVFCQNGRVTQIQVQGLGLQGPLPQNFNQLSKLQNLGFQNNKFSGDLPTFSGLSNLQYAFLDYNQFSTIPADFFNGLSSIRILALDSNPFNQSSGWMIPSVLAEASQLVNFSCSSCNIVGRVPDFFGKLPSLSLLRLAYNRLSGSIPQSFQDSMLQILWLNNQEGGGLTGSIDVIGSIVGLSVVWLHGNSFTGSIPDNIGDLTSLRELRIGTNQLVGLIPPSLANMNLQILDLSNNMFMGPIPKFRAANVSYQQNSFCESNPGQQCGPEVSALLEFLHDVNYPIKLASQWSGNDPCKGPWWGITCSPSGHVSVINLPKLGLNGPLSASLANLLELREIHLSGNNLNGTIPVNLTSLRLLRLIDVSGNDFGPPLPRFGKTVIIIIDGNPKLTGGPSKGSPPGSDTAGSPSSDSSNGSSSNGSSSTGHHSRSFKVLVSVVTATGVTVCAFLGLLLGVYCLRKREEEKKAALVKHHKDSSDPGNKVKILAADNSSLEARNGTSVALSEMTDGLANPHVIETGNLVISVQVLCKVTNNFTQENELGRGGFGSVYKGEFEDGTKIAVKRMQAGIISNKALDEFKSEIVVLSSVRHRHLVSLLGYSIEDSERLLVYEYMPKGALSRHLFRWKSLNLEPLSWTSRLQIALDVARGVEYLHSLARQSFIHRDLKSSNILLDDAFRAKVSDFGLVKLAPDKERSVATRLAGTFGYLAPEYAVTGKITTKVDVFSFGVVLMELLMGLVALDEQRPEESRYLVEWFWQRKSNKEKLIASIDPAIDAKEDIYESIYIIAKLAGHCTARDPNHRPDMGHVVNVLSPLVGQWKPVEETDDYSSFDVTLPLPQMLKGWQEEPTTQDLDLSGTSQDSRGSIASKPSGFADSFTSADAR